MPDKFQGVLILFGPPASGKGTLADHLATTHFGCGLYSSGDDLREILKQQSNDSRLLKQMLDQGFLAPEYIMEALIDRLIQRIKREGRLIMDGYPRHAAQILMLAHRLRQHGIPWTHMIELTCSPETSRARTLKRAQEKSGRTDDTLTVLETRLQIFQGEAPRMRSTLEEQGIKLITVNAEQPKHEVFRQVAAALPLAA